MSDPDPTAPLSAPRASPEAPDALGEGRVFGRYLIVGRVGAGGVGEVYAAYDPNLDRRVALKVLRAPSAAAQGGTTGDEPPTQMPGWEALVREAQALAKLSHPHVVAVHDVGAVGGQAFIAMELVDGVDLSRWLARRPPPPWRTTLRVLIEAGQGLAAAHDKQTIHRDFKPANVLVGNDGRARVSDFGLARLHAPTASVGAGEPAVVRGTSTDRETNQDTDRGRTRPEALVGTPIYMAPEQYAGAPASIQTDLYAFCLTLHEALYDVRPFADAKTLAALAAAKAQGAPSPPASAGAIPRRIRQAIARGLAPDPADRWPSMPALLAALAHDGSSRARRWAAVLVIGTGAAVAGAVGARQTPCTGAQRHLDGIWDDARRERLSAVFAGSGLAYAADSEPPVRRALDAYAEDWIDTHTRICEAGRQGETSTQGLEVRMACLDRHRAGLGVLLNVLARGDAVAIEHALPAVQALPAAAACSVASGLAGPAAPADPQVAQAVATQRERLAQVAVLASAGLHREALPQAEAIVAAANALAYLPLQAEAQFRLGRVQTSLVALGPAEAALTDALWMAHRAGHAAIAGEAAVALVALVGAHQARPDQGMWWARYAEAELQRTAAGPAEFSSLANNRGLVLQTRGDHAQAEQAFAEALARLDEAGLADSTEAAATIDNVGVALRQRGALKESIATHERALALRRAAFGAEHPAVANSMNNLAAALNADGQFARAEHIGLAVVAIREAAYGPMHPGVATALNNLAGVYFARGEYERAEAAFRRVLAIRTAQMPGHHKTASALANVALVVQTQGRLDEAAALYEQLLAMQGDNDTPQAIAITLNNLGNLQAAQGQRDTAVETYRRAVELLEGALGPDHPELGLPLHNLGNLLEERGELLAARAVQQRSLQVREAALGPDHLDVAYSLVGLSGTYQAADEPAPAVPLLERALAIATQAQGPDALRGMIEFELAQALRDSGGDGARARTLGLTARQRYVALPGQQDALAAMDAWLAGHG